MSENEVFKIGQVLKIHGVKGKIEMSVTEDVFVYAECDYLFFKLEGLLVPFFVDSYISKGADRALVKLDDIDDADGARLLLNAEVYFPLEEMPEREREVNTWNYLTGFKIYDLKEGYIGEVRAVNTQSANTLLFVETSNGQEVMIPVHPELVRDLNEKKREMLMDLPEGLLTLTV